MYRINENSDRMCSVIVIECSMCIVYEITNYFVEENLVDKYHCNIKAGLKIEQKYVEKIADRR